MRSEKKCYKCLLILPLSNFGKDRTSKKDGHMYCCKSCAKQFRENHKKNNLNRDVYSEIVSKICSRCKMEQPSRNFYKRNDKLNGLESICINCNKIEYKDEHYTRMRKNATYKRLYDLSYSEYKQKCIEQNNQCAICKQNCKLVVDHCHDTNKIRKLLCNKCNTGLGAFKENIFNLINAAYYINDHIEEPSVV